MLMTVIEDYLNDVKKCMELFRKKIGDKHPIKAWRNKSIPKSGQLSEDINYDFHGVGCCVEFPDYYVDFDFGNNGESNGFDKWRIASYIDERIEDYSYYEKQLYKYIDDTSLTYKIMDLIEKEFQEYINNGTFCKIDKLFYLSKDIRKVIQSKKEMSKVAQNSLGMLDCISMNILLHIPHSSSTIPSWEKYEINPIGEVELLTDWASDKIFDLPYYEMIVFPYSRVFCDVERLAENEPMEDVGMGFFYTHTDAGKRLRFEDNKKRVYNEFYIPHHEKLNKKVDAMLSEFGEVLIVDCHTFTDVPFQRDIDKNRNRPDICLGVTESNTNKKIVKHYSDFFEKKGFRVAINQPYSGSMLPLKYIGNSCVQTIMIEVNRKLYMSNNTIDEEEVKNLNKIMREVIVPLEIVLSPHATP